MARRARPAVKAGRMLAAALWQGLTKLPVSDAGLALGLVFAAAVLLRLAHASPVDLARNPQADALAERFAADGDAIALEERLGFAPRLQPLITLRAKDVQTDARGGLAVPLPAEALGAIVLQGLPPRARLSAGLPLGQGAWALAPGDIDDLEVVLPADAPPLIGLSVAAYAPDGATRGSLELRIVHEAPPLAAAPASGIRTGAVDRIEAPARSGPQWQNKTGARAARSKTRKQRHAKAAVIKVRVRRSAPAPAVTLPQSSPLALFTPASDAAPPASAAGKGAAGLIQLGVFPRSPMEEEAARR